MFNGDMLPIATTRATLPSNGIFGLNRINRMFFCEVFDYCRSVVGPHIIVDMNMNSVPFCVPKKA